MDILTEEQRMLLDNVRRVAKQKVAPAAAELDRRGEFSWETSSLFWDLGLLQIMLPEGYGGWPVHPCCTLCLCIEEIAKVCASSALMLIIQAVGSFPLIHAGNDSQKKNYFPMLSEQRKLIGYLGVVARMELIAAMRGVDYVVPWDDGSQFVTGAIEIIKPNIFAKGGDRSVASNVPEYDTCCRLGVAVVFGIGGHTKLRSSSDMINKLDLMRKQ